MLLEGTNRQRKMEFVYIEDLVPKDHILNMKFENSFYNIKVDLRNVQAPPEQGQQTLDVASLIAQIQKSPELLETLSQLIAAKA